MNASQTLRTTLRLVHGLRPSVLYAALALLTVIAGATLIMRTAPEAMRVATGCGLVGGLVWGLVGSRLLLVQRALRAMHAAQGDRVVRLALLLLALPTLLMPALAIGLCARSSWSALALLMMMNAAGLLWAVAPVPVAIVAAMLWSSTGNALRFLPGPVRLPLLLVLAAAMLVYARHAWRRALFSEGDSRWPLGLAPWVLRLGDQPGLGSRQSMLKRGGAGQRSAPTGMARR